MTRGRGKWLVTVAVLGYLILYILPLGGRPLIMPDETRYGEIPREMLASGDYVVPRLNGVRYFEKPVLGYWCTALSMAVFGETPFAGRFPSAASAGVSALLVFLLVRRFSTERSLAAFAAIAFLLCFVVFAIGVVNVLDGLFAMWVTGALAAFFFAYQSRSGRRVACLVLMGVLCGAAFLTKGFLGFALPAIVIAPFLIWERRWRLLFTMPWIPLAVALAVILPWALVIHARESDFWHYFVVVEHFKRFAGTGGKAQHPEPFWYYLPVLIGGALPWTPLFPAAVLGLKTARLKSPLERLATCWFVSCFLFFCLSKGKLGTYILPCFPPLAILTAIGLTMYLRNDRRRALVVGAVFLSVLAAVVCVGVALYPIETEVYAVTASLSARRWALSAAFGLWSLLVLLSLRARRSARFLPLFCTGPAIVLLTFHLVAAGLYHRKKMPGRFLQEHASAVAETAILISGGHLAGAVSWFYRRDDVHVLTWGVGELSYGFEYADTRQRLHRPEDVYGLIKTNAGKRPVIAILDAHLYSKLAPVLPKPMLEDKTNSWVFARY